MKVYGTLERAQAETLTSDPTGADLVVGRIWYRTDTKLFKVYDGSAVQTFADLTTAQTFSNKTLTTPTINASAIVQQIVTPANPSAGTNKVYSKSDDFLYNLNSAGSEKQQADTSSVQTLSNKIHANPEMTGSLLAEELGATPANPAAGKSKLYFKGSSLYKLNSAGVETAFGAGQTLTTDTFQATGTWTAPTGVTQVTVSAYRANVNTISGDTGVNSAGDLYAWGEANSGQVGDGTQVDKSSPVLVVGGLKFKSVSKAPSNALGIDFSDNGYAWGTNANGQLGDSTVAAKSSPVAVIGGLKFIDLKMPNTAAMGITTDGKLYTWGQNSQGQLGDGTVVPKSSPVLVVGGLRFKKLATATYSGNMMGAITVDGDAYSWGGARHGDGTTTATSSPVAVSGGLKFIDYALHKNSGNTTCGGAVISSSNDLYTWGGNDNGQLGDGTTTANSSPVQVMNAFKFKQVAGSNGFIMMLTTGGDLYGVGLNTSGQLGDGTSTAKSSPVLVVGGLKFVSVSTGGNGNMVSAVSTDGTLYAWGGNSSGYLGDGTVVDRSSPVAVIGGLKFMGLYNGASKQALFNVTAGQTYKVDLDGFYGAFNRQILGELVSKIEISYFA